MRVDQLVEAVDEERRDPDVAYGCLGFGWAEPPDARDLVQRPGVSTDVDDGPVEVRVGSGEGGQLTEWLAATLTATGPPDVR